MGFVDSLKEVLQGVLDHADLPPLSPEDDGRMAYLFDQIADLDEAGRFCAPAGADPAPDPKTPRYVRE